VVLGCEFLQDLTVVRPVIGHAVGVVILGLVNRLGRVRWCCPSIVLGCRAERTEGGGDGGRAEGGGRVLQQQPPVKGGRKRVGHGRFSSPNKWPGSPLTMPSGSIVVGWEGQIMKEISKLAKSRQTTCSRRCAHDARSSGSCNRRRSWVADIPSEGVT